MRSETMGSPRSSSDMATARILPTLANGRLSGSVERIGEHPLGFGGYSDVWKARMTRECGTTLLVNVPFSLPHSHF